MTSFIAQLKSRLPQADWPVVVAALRSETQVWAELQEPAFAELILHAAGADRERWSPAFLGLLRLEQSQQFESLRSAPLQPVAEKLRYQAAAAFEKLASETNGNNRTAPDLAQATLLALALRERRRLLNGWDQLAENLSIASPEFWRLTISVLFGILPNPQELLSNLISPDQNGEIQELGIYALVSNPLSLDVQSAHLLELVRDFPLPQFLALLRSIANLSPNLAKHAAAQALENLPAEAGADSNGLAEIQRLLLEAEVSQIGGQSSKADGLLRSAWEASRQLESQLASQLSESETLDSETIAELQKSAEPKKLLSKSKRPATLLSAAKVALKSEDFSEAKEMALAALNAATREAETDSRNGAILRELSHLFSELQMPAEALAAAEAAATASPSDAESVLQYGKLLLQNDMASEALQQAHLAAALAPQNSEVRRNLARSLQDNEQYEESFQEWKAMLDNEAEPSLEDWLAFAEAGLHNNHFDETLKACQYALMLQSTNGAAYALIGSALLAQGDDGSARAHLRRATELAPAQPEAWTKLAELQLAQMDPEEALASLIAAQLFIQPTAAFQALLADVYLALDRTQDALAAYKNAAKLANEEADAKTAQAAALKISELQLRSDAREAALHTLEAAQQSFPNNAEIATQLGRLLLEFNEPKRALVSLKQALQADPENPILLMDIARAQIAINELAGDAEQTLEIILAHKDAPSEAKALLAEAKAAQGKYSEAIKAYDNALKPFADDKLWTKRLALGKARSQAASGKPVAAISTLESLGKGLQDDLDIQRQLCICYQEANRGEEAAQIAQKIYLGALQDEDTVVWYAELMEALGKSTQASKALSRSAITANPSPRLILSLAKLQWTGDSPETAQKTLAQITRSGDGEISAQAGKFLLERGAHKESIAYFKRALDMSAPQIDWLENLATAYIKTEQWSGALDALDQAIRLAPHKPEILEQKANVLLKLGKPQSALQTIETSLQLLPNNVTLLARKAQILREQQDWTSALGTAAKAFELDPSHNGNLQMAAELAVLCLQPDLAREFLSKGAITSKPNLDLACLQAELALEAGLEIEAAKALANAMDEGHPRVLAMQSRLAACRGDRSQAAQVLQKAIETREQQAKPDIFTTYAVAKAAEKLNDWQKAISLYETLSKDFQGQPLGHFSLGRAIVLRAEWQQLCEASQANVNNFSSLRAKRSNLHHGTDDSLISDVNPFSKEAKTICKQALAAAFSVAGDSAVQAMISGWQIRADLRFGAKLEVDTLHHSFPATAAEAAALLYAARRSGDLPAAEERVKAFANAPEVSVEKAIANLEDDIHSALEIIQQAAVLLLQSAPVQALAAHIARKAGELVTALPFIQRALALWPDQANWQTLAGEIQQALGNLMEAKGHFTIATQLEPEVAKHYFALGNVQVAAHILEEGIRNLQGAGRLEPKRAEYSLALASAYRKSGDGKQARSFAQQAQKLAPQDPSTLLLQAELALEEGEGQAAKQYVQQALKIAPKDTAALLMFAEALHNLGENEEAIAVLDSALETAVDELPLLIRRAQMQTNVRGLDSLVKLSQHYTDRPEVFFALSEALAASGSVADAIQAAQRAAKKAGKETSPDQLARMHLHLGKLLKQSGNLDQSLHHLDQTAKLAPHSAASQIERGRVFLARRQLDQAMKAFQQAATVAPHDATPHFELGLSLKDAKDYKAAEAELRKAAKLAPKDRHIQRQLAAVIALNLVHHPVEVGATL